jgi:hypothetical protein
MNKITLTEPRPSSFIARAPIPLSQATTLCDSPSIEKPIADLAVNGQAYLAALPPFTSNRTSINSWTYFRQSEWTIVAVCAYCKNGLCVCCRCLLAPPADEDIRLCFAWYNRHLLSDLRMYIIHAGSPVPTARPRHQGSRGQHRPFIKHLGSWMCSYLAYCRMVASEIQGELSHTGYSS